MALDNALIAFKKLFNKANTSPDKPLLPNETISVGFTATAESIFAESIPSDPGTSVDYDQDSNNVVEKITLVAEFIAGTDSPAGRHGFQLKLPSDYETSSSNPLAGTFPWINDQILWQTTGAIQIVPPLFGDAYAATLKDTTNSTIPPLDAREWIPYEFGGIIYQQTPPGTGADPENPGYYECHIYIGDFVIDGVGSTGGSGGWTDFSGSFLYTTSSVEITGALSVTSGISGSHTQLVDGTDAFLAGPYTTINFNNVGAVEITGSKSTAWNENNGQHLSTTSSVEITGALSVTSGISGSHTQLVDGTDAFLAGPYTTINFNNAGAVEITGSKSTAWNENNGLHLSTTSSIEVTGALSVTSGISGSHTQLVDGTDAFLAGPYTTINFNNAGAVEITGSKSTAWNENNGQHLSTTSSVQITGNLDVQDNLNIEGVFSGLLSSSFEQSGELSPNVLTSVEGLSSDAAFTLPDISTVKYAKDIYALVDSGGQGDIYDITVTPNGTNTIDGATGTIKLPKYGFRGFVRNGSTNWSTILTTQDNSVTVVTTSNGELTLDASKGPNFSLNVGESFSLLAPSNAKQGQEIKLSMLQVSGNNTITITSSNWTNIGQLEQIDLNSGSYSLLNAVYRDHTDNATEDGKWLYVITSNEAYPQIFDIDMTGSTSGSESLTMAQGYLAEDGKVGLFDYSILAKSTASYEQAQFGVRTLVYRTGSNSFVKNEDFYSYYTANGVWNVTHSVSGNIAEVNVNGSSSQDVDWRIKGIFKVL